MTQDLFLYSLSWSQPELILAGAALATALLGALFGQRATSGLVLLGAAALVAAGILALRFTPSAPQVLFQGAFVADGFAAIAKAVIAFAAAATLLLGSAFFTRGRDTRFEFPLLVLTGTLGMFVMVSANDLITLYVGVELQSLPAYVLAAWRRDDARGSEAGLKYFVLGALSSGLLLYGCSFIYGFSGSIRFDEIALAVSQGATGVGMTFGLVFLLCGIAFKMSAAPFHMWTPDVYEGAPTPVTAFFAAAPKLAAIALMARVLYEPFADMADSWRQVIVVFAALSMAVGAFAALVQTNIKRLLAYSSIFNMGFALMALAAGAPQGAVGALVYMIIYLPSIIGVFAVVMMLQRRGEEAEQIDDLSGLAQRHVGLASVLTVLLFSIAGIPPLAGFWTKFAALIAAIDAGLWPLAVIGVLCTTVAAGYYLMLISRLWFRPSDGEVRTVGALNAGVAATAAVLTFPVLLVLLGAVEGAVRLAVERSF
jgi:NADH-quinone oxidoreductase subunit N